MIGCVVMVVRSVCAIEDVDKGNKDRNKDRI